MNKVLEETISQTQKTVIQEEWKGEFEKIANIMLDNRSFIQKFYKSCKQYEHLDFYLTPVTTIPLNIFIITVRYLGQEISTITITKDNHKITITEILREDNTQDTVIQRATNYAIFLLSLLHSENIDDKYYKLFDFHGRNPITHTIKVVIEVNKKIAGRYKEHEPIQIPIGADTIKIYSLYYETDKDNTKITNIKTDLNKVGN